MWLLYSELLMCSINQSINQSSFISPQLLIQRVDCSLNILHINFFKFVFVQAVICLNHTVSLSGNNNESNVCLCQLFYNPYGLARGDNSSSLIHTVAAGAVSILGYFSSPLLQDLHVFRMTHWLVSMSVTAIYPTDVERKQLREPTS